MTVPIILASGSEIRAVLLRNAGVNFSVVKARIDEEAVKSSLEQENATPRDVADALAEMKAAKVAARSPDALVLGCDQVLAFEKSCLSKPTSPENAACQLRALRGKSHQLLSAAVLYENGKPVWRHVGQVRLQMRDFSDAYVTDYVSRNWDDIRHCVGGYQLEREGVRLFRQVSGDHFHVLGLPLIELLNYLTTRGVLAG